MPDFPTGTEFLEVPATSRPQQATSHTLTRYIEVSTEEAWSTSGNGNSAPSHSSMSNSASTSSTYRPQQISPIHALCWLQNEVSQLCHPQNGTQRTRKLCLVGAEILLSHQLGQVRKPKRSLWVHTFLISAQNIGTVAHPLFALDSQLSSDRNLTLLAVSSGSNSLRHSFNAEGQLNSLYNVVAMTYRCTVDAVTKFAQAQGKTMVAAWMEVMLTGTITTNNAIHRYIYIHGRRNNTYRVLLQTKFAKNVYLYLLVRC